jgi:hypothetical protein
MGNLSEFDGGQIIGARLAGVSVTRKACHSVGCGEREREFVRLCRHARIVGRQHQRRGAVGEHRH